MFSGEDHAAPFAARGRDVTGNGQTVNDLRQVIVRHPEIGGDVRDGGTAIRLQGQIDQHPQRVVRIAKQFHTLSSRPDGAAGP